MKIAYFDCFAGIAGDMALGALLDCGAPLDELKSALQTLKLEDWDIETAPTLKNGIHGLQVRITQSGQTDHEELHARQHEHEHHHDHEHSHEHNHHDHSPIHTHGRSMAQIRDLIEASELSARVKVQSLAVFERIAEAEAQIHHMDAAEVHFHEIGGLDSIVDIVGVCWCLEYLGVEEVRFSPLPSSRGWVDCAHGQMPVPAPATLLLLRNVPLIATEIEGEMVTPTGAGIVAALGASFGGLPSFTPQKVGAGAGRKNWPDRPNLLRVIIGDTFGGEMGDNENGGQSVLQVLAAQLPGLKWQQLQIVECNLDDMNPEFFAHVMERIFDAGALDVWLQPLQMKKNRPAHLLSALCAIDDAPAIVRTILRETTTLGVRLHSVERASLEREMGAVATPFGKVRVKIARWDEADLRRAKPEWDDVQRLARENHVTAREVYDAAQRAFE